MKQNLKIIVLSFFSALFAVIVYNHFFINKYFFEEMKKARYVAFDDFLFGERSSQNDGEFTNNISLVKAAKRGMPSVVSIKTVNNTVTDFWNMEGASQTSGSGVIISPDGYIVTNYHVVEKNTEITVITQNKDEWTARLLGADPATDIAVLKVDKENLPFAFFGNSDSLQVGEPTLAIGFPFKLDCTATAGIISALGRNINVLEAPNSIESFIQTDAIVNPGNSGGGLFNTNGELIGINTAIVSQTGKYEGYSFAAPSNLVKKIVFDIKNFGRVQRGMLGVNIDNMSMDQAKDLGLVSEKGVYISSVSIDGAAAMAGIKPGSIILAIDGHKIQSFPELQEQIARHRPNESVELTIWYNRQRSYINVLLKEQAIVNIIEWGCELRPLNSKEKAESGKDGILVISVYKNQIFAKSNIEPGFVVVKLNGVAVNHPDQIIQALKKSNKNFKLEGYYKNYDGSYFYTVSK